MSIFADSEARERIAVLEKEINAAMDRERNIRSVVDQLNEMLGGALKRIEELETVAKAKPKSHFSK